MSSLRHLGGIDHTDAKRRQRQGTSSTVLQAKRDLCWPEGNTAPAALPGPATLLAGAKAAADRVRSTVLDERTGPLGGRLRAKSLGQLADLGFWVAPVAAEGLQVGQLAFLGPAGHGLG